eukprot:gnl/MRDRNA2_/MRDRNA2_34302_c0_seq1.p1 gnl/MRDRNA2_/MRDRNA2_34302_c0~~gnl/MRDRNA2_/MRDRNA2_34302_c0_seq1.p1  ORF type:complete len:260 (+),score=31.50 gnl/MRDRNA2_/MRDRNA2_34302_c0_seq1:72-851(+)
MLCLSLLFTLYSGVASKWYNSKDCIAFTDETCAAEDKDKFCANSHSETTCQSDGTCACVMDCVGVDEKCYSGKYEELSGPYDIQNAAWAGQFLYLPTMGGLKVSDEKDESSLFTISLLPGSVYLDDVNKNPKDRTIVRDTREVSIQYRDRFSGQGILLMSVKYHNYAVVVKEGRRLQEVANQSASEEASLSRRLAAGADVMKLDDKGASIDDLGLFLWKAPKGIALTKFVPGYDQWTQRPYAIPSPERFITWRLLSYNC